MVTLHADIERARQRERERGEEGEGAKNRYQIKLIIKLFNMYMYIVIVMTDICSFWLVEYTAEIVKVTNVFVSTVARMQIII